MFYTGLFKLSPYIYYIPGKGYFTIYEISLIRFWFEMLLKLLERSVQGLYINTKISLFSTSGVLRHYFLSK